MGGEIGIEMISVLMLVSFMVLIIGLGMPIAFATGIIAVVFCYLFADLNSLIIVVFRTYGFINSYALLAVPMFLLMAAILDRSGVAHELYDALRLWAGGMRGGIAVITLVAAVFMAAMTGIIGGEIILLGLVALPQMLRLGYDRKMSIGVVCAGGSLGVMVPPSIVMVFYGLTVEKSIGDLFLASATPGLMLGGMYIAYVLIRCSINPALAPPPPAEERDVPIRDKLLALRKIVLPVGIIICVLGSIYGGFAAVSEAAALGAAAVALAAAIRGRLTWEVMRGSLLQTMTTCGLLLWLNFGANSLVGVYNLLGGITFLKGSMVGLGEEVSPLFILFIMMAIFFVLGMFMDWFSIMLLTMPVFVPTIESFGYDPIWFGVLFNMNMQMAFLTPPFGLAAFYLKSVAPPDISLNEIFRALLPFIGLQAIGLLLVVFFPEIAMWLPEAMRG